MKKQSQPITPRNENNTQEKLKVVLRIRPFLANEDPEEFISMAEDNVISINKMGMPSLMKFNYVQLEDHAKQSERCEGQQKIYSFLDESVKGFYEGIDSTIFAYGQTGAGKTYTIVGDCPQSSSNADFRPFLMNQNKGIMVRAMQFILLQKRKRHDCRITVSFFEIYNEKIFDLLCSVPKPLQIREGKSGQISILGLLTIEIADQKQALSCIAEGLKNRVTSSTSGNIKSSRSHSIFHVRCERLKINEKHPDDYDIVVSNLRIIDLAGSQKFNIPSEISSEEREIRLTELKSINGSLSKLGHCISALTSQSRTHIPFRDSKLTRVLRQSLLGPSKIRLIVCVSPSHSAMNETLSTLQFADRIKKAIFERPVSPLHSEKKKMIQLTEYEAVCEELQKQRKKRIQLENIVKQMRNIDSNELDLIRENISLRQEVTLLKQELKVFQNRNKLGPGAHNQNRLHAKSNNVSPRIPSHSPALQKKPNTSMYVKRYINSTQNIFFEVSSRVREQIQAIS